MRLLPLILRRMHQRPAPHLGRSREKEFANSGADLQAPPKVSGETRAAEPGRDCIQGDLGFAGRAEPLRQLVNDEDFHKLRGIVPSGS